MKKAPTLILTALLILFLGTAASAQKVISGRVVSSYDGDTVTVRDNANRKYKIRFQGIDAPEKAQTFGQQSANNLSNMVLGKFVRVYYEKTDKYGRIAGKVVLPGGTDVNLEQVKAGMAWHYKQFQNEQSPQDRQRYASAEVQARNSSRGLWQDPDPMPPWRWRQEQKNKPFEELQPLFADIEKRVTLTADAKAEADEGPITDAEVELLQERPTRFSGMVTMNMGNDLSIRHGRLPQIANNQYDLTFVSCRVSVPKGQSVVADVFVPNENASIVMMPQGRFGEFDLFTGSQVVNVFYTGPLGGETSPIPSRRITITRSSKDGLMNATCFVAGMIR